ncbi:MAG: hypothetical protein ACKVOX_05690 [Rhizobacter sp.]
MEYDAHLEERIDASDEVHDAADVEEIVDISVRCYAAPTAVRSPDAILCGLNGTNIGTRKEPESADDRMRVKAAEKWLNAMRVAT